MAYRNTAETFGSVAKALHWAIAVCFVISYVSVYYAIAYPVDGQVANDIAVQIHITTGIIVAVLIAVRVYWRLTGIRPGFLISNDNLERVARVSHGALYACMIIQPLSATNASAGCSCAPGGQRESVVDAERVKAICQECAGRQ